ncbi:hypothetical protein LVJ94_06070 [Pendulispora rubella]|uniref:Histidine kinase/HSP90-like ATPase domain-containing protein n=1 Tax=Pendulispora rubella TaxID=2741070 RepID=A0ABZ2L7E5_9BACT
MSETCIELDLLPSPGCWAKIRELRQRVKRLMASYDEDVQDAAVMTASELLENALKYGVPVEGTSAARFELRLDGGALTIATTNVVDSDADGTALRERIERIMREPDKEALYVQRLQDFVDASAVAGGLGLYRVAFEGAFDLQCATGNKMVVVTARRAVP